MVNDITSAYSEIQELFKSKLTKAVNDAEVYRQKKMKLYKIFNGLAIFLLVCFICDILFAQNYEGSFSLPECLNNDFFSIIIVVVLLLIAILPLILPILALICFFVAHLHKFFYVKTIKEKLYPYIFQAIDKGLIYYGGSLKIFPKFLKGVTFGQISINMIEDIINTIIFLKKDIPQEKLIGLDILPKHTNFITDDIIIGKYKNKKVSIVEFSLKNKEEHKYNSSHSNSSQEHEIFKGIAFETNMEKPVKGRFFIKQKHTGSGMNLRNFEKIVLESNEFNSIYDVYGTDQVEARYFLTTSLMEQLIGLYKKGQIVTITVENQKISVVKKTQKDMFEPVLKDPINKPEAYYDVLYQTKTILDFITELKLDSNIGL